MDLKIKLMIITDVFCYLLQLLRKVNLYAILIRFDGKRIHYTVLHKDRNIILMRLIL